MAKPQASKRTSKKAAQDLKDLPTGSRGKATAVKGGIIINGKPTSAPALGGPDTRSISGDILRQ